MDFEDVMHLAVDAFEAVGVLVLVLGSLASFVIAAGHVRQGAAAFKPLRRDLGRVILLGLEILIVADIITTITLDQTPSSAITLGIVVLVRTFLSFSLEIELDGVLPWRRAALSGTTGEDAV